MESERPAYWKETLPSMLRRCRDWDYRQCAIYMITVVLADRSTQALGKIAVDKSENGHPSAAHCELSDLGRAVAACWEAIPRFYPGIQIIAKEVMPDHFHGILWVKRPLDCHLGQVIKGFKLGCNKAAGGPLFAEGFQDTILFREGQLAAMIKYLKENPLRLAIKRTSKELFILKRDIEAPLGEAGTGHFSAIGNTALLNRPLVQVQCSRRYFAYRRVPKPGGGQKIARDQSGEPICESCTAEYRNRLEAVLSAAKHGAVLISPCVSDGERQIAREALLNGLPLVTMQNKGFSPLQKPSGRYFEACSEGRLLLLAPAAWPYQPGEKPMTRFDATAMNRVCQLLAGEGAAEINYHGMTPANIDRLALEAVAAK